MLNSAKAGARGRGRWFALDSTVYEQAQSNRAFNIFNFALLGRDSYFLYFSNTSNVLEESSKASIQGSFSLSK
jgi:hypothetical protein